MTLHHYWLRLTIFFLLLGCALHSEAQQESDALEEGGEETLISDTLTSDTLPALPWPESLKARLETLTEGDMFETSQLGMMVYDLTADSTLFARGERQRLRPASTMKLLTAITAIDRLGGSFQYLTSLYYKGEVVDSVFTGDIYCKGGFDPLFGSDDLRAFAKSVKALDIDTLRGRILADKSFKDTALLGEGWCWDDDNPTLSPLLVSRHDDFCRRLVDQLQEEGIVAEVTIEEAKVPDGATLLCTRSHTLDQALMRMMKKSDNLYAESMLYQIAATKGLPAKAKAGADIVRQTLSRAGGDASRVRVADGSGLSLYNYVTAEAEVKLLRLAWRNSNIFLHLYPSLPIAAEDGTLSKRMRGTKAAGNVHAKTGTLEGISSLAGYCTAANGHMLCFAIINQGIRYNRSGHTFQDRVCQALCAD